ncbi:MAG: aldose 1-epimerase [Wujia sp.]
MSYSANIVDYKGKDVIELTAGKYKAVVAPFLGSNVIRMQDTEAGIEIFRYDASLSVEELKASAEVYGLPTLYLPNRLANGVLKVSDATYHFPLNDPLGNHIHGFLHLREHTIVSASVDGAAAIAKTQYVYDDKDEFFSIFPVSFKAEFTFTLSDEGLSYAFTMTNTSDKQLPFGVCNHTTINGPFTKDGEGLDMRLYVPIGDKWELSKTCIPTGEFLPITNHDRQYLTGSQVPVLHDIDNDVFFAEEGTLDGHPYYGVVASDAKTGKRICYEVCKDFKFWIIWNDHGEKGFFCPEPCTWIIDAPNQPIPDDESGYVELAPGESKTLTEKIYTM